MVKFILGKISVRLEFEGFHGIYLSMFHYMSIRLNVFSAEHRRPAEPLQQITPRAQIFPLPVCATNCYSCCRSDCKHIIYYHPSLLLKRPALTSVRVTVTSFLMRKNTITFYRIAYNKNAYCFETNSEKIFEIFINSLCYRVMKDKMVAKVVTSKGCKRVINASQNCKGSQIKMSTEILDICNKNFKGCNSING